jgi:heptaprenylglyceryl phosphate synthase
MIYMDAGSGAKNPVSKKMIKDVKTNIDIPLMVGGGINTPDKLAEAFKSGADIVVTGNALEKSPDMLASFMKITRQS